MALADDLRTLRSRTIADLHAAHDYFTDTKLAWDIVQRAVESGGALSVQNKATGTVTTGADLVARAPGYIARHLTEATFQQFISIFESFFFDLLRLWLMAYPQSLIGKKVDFKVVLEAPDKDAIAMTVIDRELNDIMYERPAGWFAYLEDRMKIGCPTADTIERFAEAKASRDVLIHNRGIASKIYESKAGRRIRFKDGQRIDVSEPYHRDVWELLGKVVAEIADAAISKVTPP